MINRFQYYFIAQNCIIPPRLKRSVIEDGLTALTSETLKPFYGIGTLFTPNLITVNGEIQILYYCFRQFIF